MLRYEINFYHGTDLRWKTEVIAMSSVNALAFAEEQMHRISPHISEWLKTNIDAPFRIEISLPK